MEVTPPVNFTARWTRTPRLLSPNLQHDPSLKVGKQRNHLGVATPRPGIDLLQEYADLAQIAALLRTGPVFRNR